MPRPLARRIARLERGTACVCPACGLGGPGPVTYEVVVPEAVGMLTEYRKIPKPPHCHSCGRQTAFPVVMPAARG